MNLASAAQARGVEQQRQLRPAPFADRAPPLDAIVPGHLRALREPADIVEAEAQRGIDQTADREPPIGKAFLGVARVIAALRIGRAIAAEIGRDCAARIFRGEGRAVAQQPVRALVPPFGCAEQRLAGIGFGDPIAARHEGRAGGDEKIPAPHGSRPPVIMSRIWRTGPARMTSTTWMTKKPAMAKAKMK